MPETSAATIGMSSLHRLRAATVATRPWGREFWYAHDDNAAQIMEIQEGQALTLQPPPNVGETLCLLSGRAWFHLNGLNFEFIPGAYLPIAPGDVCGLHAIENSLVLIMRSDNQAHTAR